MTIRHRHFNVAVVALATLALALFPIWPWCHWGFFPSFLVLGIVLFMYTMKRLARV
jgi:hypothetical protein